MYEPFWFFVFSYTFPVTLIFTEQRDSNGVVLELGGSACSDEAVFVCIQAISELLHNFVKAGDDFLRR